MAVVIHQDILAETSDFVAVAKLSGLATIPGRGEKNLSHSLEPQVAQGTDPMRQSQAEVIYYVKP